MKTKKLSSLLVLFILGLFPNHLFLSKGSALSAQIIRTVIGDGATGYSGNGGPAILASVDGPNAVIIDHSGNIYLCDQSNNVIRMVNAAGIISTYAGNGVAGFSGDGGPAIAAEFNQPTVITYDSLQNFYVVDFNNNRIRKINTSGIITTIAGNGVYGYSGNGGAATAAELAWPTCVIADNANNLFISDAWNNVIREVNSSGIISLVAGNSVAGYGGDGGAATLAQLNKPFRIAFDHAWNLYIADAFNSRIRFVNTSGIITTAAGNGIASYSGDGGPASAAEVNQPYGVCVDACDNVYIADTYNNRIRRINTSGMISTFAGTGAGAFGGDGGPATAAAINWPTGVMVDFRNTIYVDDYRNERIRDVPDSIIFAARVTANVSCFGGNNGSITTNLTGGTSPFTYQWLPGGGASFTATGLTAGVYVVTVTDNCGASATTSATLTQPATALGITISSVTNAGCSGTGGSITARNATGGTSPYTYLWSDANSQTTLAATSLSAGTYTLTVNDNNGCSASTSAIVTQSAVLSFSVIVTANNCSTGTGGSATVINLNGGTSPYTYSWSPSGGTNSTGTGFVAGTYTVTVTDNGGCSASSSFIIAQSSVITGTYISTEELCYGSSNASATVIANGGTPPYNYAWNPGGGVGPTVDGLSAGTYTVTIIDANGCTGSVTVIINQPLQILVEFSSSLNAGCSPLCIQFRNASNANGIGISSYVWTFGDGDSSHAENPIHCYLKGGTYSVGLTVTTDSGCSATLTKVNMINVFYSPDAAFSVYPQPATIVNPTIQFTNLSSDQYGTMQWLWLFGDNTDSTSTLKDPSHTYQDTGEYCATLVATDIHGCADTVTECLEIEPLFTLYIPNTFSPNGDGLNDVFAAKGRYIKSFEMMVFDRWGEEIFHSNSINDGWNGIPKGGTSICQEGTYAYKIFVTDFANKQYSYNGYVLVIK